MYRFIRTATLKTGANTPAAMSFGLELVGYLNKKYGVNIQYGMELFGGNKAHWHFEADSVDQITALNTKLMEDKEYWAKLDRAKDVWLDGSLKDTVVMFPR